MKIDKSLLYGLLVALILLFIAFLTNFQVNSTIKGFIRDYQETKKMKAEEDDARDMINRQKEKTPQAIASIQRKLFEWKKTHDNTMKRYVIKDLSNDEYQRIHKEAEKIQNKYSNDISDIEGFVGNGIGMCQDEGMDIICLNVYVLKSYVEKVRQEIPPVIEGYKLNIERGGFFEPL